MTDDQNHFACFLLFLHSGELCSENYTTPADHWLVLQYVNDYLAARILMKIKRETYNTFHRISAVLMILALLWLTISAPFVYAGQQELAKQNKTLNTQSPLAGNEEETANPFGNSTEEKAPGGNSFSEEYLHDNHVTDHFFSASLQYHKCENTDIYIAFHGELLVPPPDAA